VDWIVVAQNRDKWRALANAVISLAVLQNDGKLTSGYNTDGFSGISQLHRVC
jgi:hypothetical protein